MGQITGSHLDLPWREEFQDKVIWVADIEGDRVSLWRIVADTGEIRSRYGLPTDWPPPGCDVHPDVNREVDEGRSNRFSK